MIPRTWYRNGYFYEYKETIFQQSLFSAVLVLHHFPDLRKFTSPMGPRELLPKFHLTWSTSSKNHFWRNGLSTWKYHSLWNKDHPQWGLAERLLRTAPDWDWTPPLLAVTKLQNIVGRSNWTKGRDPSESWVQYPNPAGTIGPASRTLVCTRTQLCAFHTNFTLGS